MIFVYAGTFDPFTLGHADIARRSASLCDRLIVAVSASRQGTMFSLEQRCALARLATEGIEGALVRTFSGLLTDLVSEVGASAIVRGARSAVDFQNETALAANYKLFAPQTETIIIPSSPSLSHVSSTVTRELIGLNADLSNHLCPAVCSAVELYRRK